MKHSVFTWAFSWKKTEITILGESRKRVRQAQRSMQTICTVCILGVAYFSNTSTHTRALSPCLTVSLSLCLSVCLSISLSLCPSVSLSLALSLCLSVCLSVRNRDTHTPWHRWQVNDSDICTHGSTNEEVFWYKCWFRQSKYKKRHQKQFRIEERENSFTFWLKLLFLLSKSLNLRTWVKFI